MNDEVKTIINKKIEELHELAKANNICLLCIVDEGDRYRSTIHGRNINIAIMIDDVIKNVDGLSQAMAAVAMTNMMLKSGEQDKKKEDK